MTKIQKINLIFLPLISFLIFFPAQPAHTQSAKANLKSADSLFMRKKYTESFALYATIFDEGKVSPKMLLKMAFIQEGLGNYTGALYYLNLYYLRTSSNLVLTKMEEIADKHQLIGYEYTDADYFLTFYRQYRSQLIFAVTTLSLLIFGFVIYQKRKTGKKPIWAASLFLLILVNIFYFINFSEDYHVGIIQQPNTYLMQGPSAGSGLLEVVKNGHRVDITGQTDVWVKIIWKGRDAYIKENNILSIEY